MRRVRTASSNAVGQQVTTQTLHRALPKHHNHVTPAAHARRSVCTCESQPFPWHSGGARAPGVAAGSSLRPFFFSFLYLQASALPDFPSASLQQPRRRGRSTWRPPRCLAAADPDRAASADAERRQGATL
eukprot:5500895-Pyramimonas_sp.AAC.1